MSKTQEEMFIEQAELEAENAAPAKMKTHELLEKLHAHYGGGRSSGGATQWAFISQLRNTTGYSSQIRTADAMAMGLWPSTGLKLIGFELKVSRSDWLHELKQPQKSEEMRQFCDEWYLVIPDMSIIKDGELPAGWGLMAALGRGRSIKVKIKAPQLDPVDVDRALLASIFRNISEKTIPMELANKRMSDLVEQQERMWKAQNKRAIEEAMEIRKQVAEFEDATGIKFTDWRRDHMELAKVVKQALEGRYDQAIEKMAQLRATSEKITKFIDGEVNRYEI